MISRSLFLFIVLHSLSSFGGTICLPRPLKVLARQAKSPEGFPLPAHPFRYSTENYAGTLSVQLGRGKEFSLASHPGLLIEGVDHSKDHILRYKEDGREVQAFRVTFQGSGELIVIDQKAHEGAFRQLPPKSKCPSNYVPVSNL